MKKIIEMWKKKSLFFKVMVIYSFVLIVAIVALCIWEWGALKDYQADYDARYAAAEEKAKLGDKACIEEYINGYTREVHRELLLMEVNEENPYYSDAELVENKLNSIDFTKISYKKNEKNYLESRPVYDVLAGDKVIATVTLSVGAMDEFGFYTWKINGVSVDTKIEYAEDITLLVENGMNVTVRDQAPPAETLKETTTITQNIYDRIYELSGEEETVMKYTITGLLNEADVKVCDAVGSELSYTDRDGERVYKLNPDKAVEEWSFPAIDRIVIAYIEFANRWMSISNMLTYTVPGSDAASAMQRTVDSIYYMRKPSTLEVISKTVDNIHVISDDLLYCDALYQVEKTVYGELVTETINFTLVLRKQGDVWLLDTMAING